MHLHIHINSFVEGADSPTADYFPTFCDAAYDTQQLFPKSSKEQKHILCTKILMKRVSSLPY